MRKAIGYGVAFLLVLALLPSQAGAQMRFGFKAYGGLAYVRGGDVNNGARGFNDLSYDYFLWLGGYSLDGEFAPLHRGMNFGGEFILQFSQNMGMGLGVGSISAANSSEIEYTPPVASAELLWEPKLSAIPITATLFFSCPPVET